MNKGHTPMKLEISNVSKQYGKKVALNGINLTLTPGIYGILGPNGAGKSTLMNILTCNLKATEGIVLLDGQNVVTMGKEYRARLGYMPQHHTFYSGFSVEHFMFYIASLRGMKKREAADRIAWVLSAVNLTDVRHKQIKGLSGGMKQRLLLAQAIIADPDILILDEPTAGLDPKQRTAVRNLIAEIGLEKIVLISTHIVSDIETIAKELILLSDGNVIQHGTPESLIRTLENKVWQAQIMAKDLPTMGRYGAIASISKGIGNVNVRLISHEKPQIPVQYVEPSLEDVYLYFFGECEANEI